MTQEEKFYEKYTPIKNTLVEDAAYDGCMFETYGDEIEEVLTYARDENKRKQVWTIADYNGKTYIQSGYHIMNRMGYLITEESWSDTDEQYVCEGGFGEEIYFIQKDEVETDEAWYDLIHKQLELPKFHDLFDEEGNFKDEYAEYFENDYEIELVHSNIESSNSDNFELLTENFKFTEQMTKDVKEKLHSRFFRIVGEDYSIKLVNYNSFDDMANEVAADEFILDFSKYE